MISQLSAVRRQRASFMAVVLTAVAAACHTVPESNPKECTGVPYLSVENNTTVAIDVVASTGRSTDVILGSVEPRSGGEFPLPGNTFQTFYRLAGTKTHVGGLGTHIITRHLCR